MDRTIVVFQSAVATVTMKPRKVHNSTLLQARETPLHESIRLGFHPSAQMLLRCGASVNLPGGRHGLTPLMLAAGAAAGPKGAYAYAYDVQPHFSGKREGRCNLYYSSSDLICGLGGLNMRMLPENAADLELLETLLEYEADVHLEDKRGWNAMK